MINQLLFFFVLRIYAFESCFYIFIGIPFNSQNNEKHFIGYKRNKTTAEYVELINGKYWGKKILVRNIPTQILKPKNFNWVMVQL